MTQSEQAEQNFTELKTALDDSSDKNRNLLIAFLVLQVYVFSATFSVTDLQLLLLDSAQSFSLFNFAIPMEGFFYVVPPVIFAFHFNLLLNLRQHAIKLERWLHHPKFVQHNHIDLLRPFIFNMRAKSQIGQNSPFSAAKIVSFMLFSFFPLGLLIFVMWRLADLQDGILITFHSFWVLADITALLHFWPKIIEPKKGYKNHTVLILFFCTITVVIIRNIFALTAINSPQTLNDLDNNRLLNFVVPRLVVTNVTLDKQDKDRDNSDITDKQDLAKKLAEQKVKQCYLHKTYQPINLSERNFNLIDLTGSTICNVNFTRSNLKVANLKDATFSGDFNLIDLRHSQLYYTKFQRQTSFIQADLSHTEIHQTIAKQVNFTFATINKSNIIDTEFSQSQFLQAKIESTIILESQFDQAELVGASLKNTTFKQSKFKLTNIDLRLVTGLNKQYFEDGTIQHCKIDYRSIPNSYEDIDTRYREEDWSIETAAAVWNISKCQVLYPPKEKAKLAAIHADKVTDNRQDLVNSLITANKLTNNDTLNLSYMGLTEINPQVFALSHLKQLNLSFNQIQTIPDAIGKLKQLQRLDLAHNQIQTIPDAPEVLAQLTQLQQLDLSWNRKIKTIPDAIAKLTQLQRLDLSLNQIQNIPKTIAKLTQLQRLDLSVNLIQTIPDAFANLTQLRQLDLSHNYIQTIPDTVAKLTQLQRLKLSRNFIQTIPDAVAKLTQLQRLELSRNYIQTIPDAVAKLTQLQRLELSRNYIQTIPDAVAKLTQLQQLNLRFNQIQTIPDAIANLTQLQKLDLSWNRIQTIPNAIANLTQLQRLDLEKNSQIKTLPTTLLQLKNLTKLCLHGIGIKALPAEFKALEGIAKFEKYCR